MDCKSAGSCVMRRRGRYGINVPITKCVANIKIVSGFTIGAGSMENPATTSVTVSIEALEGCIPDIGELLLDIQLTGAPGLEKVALTTRQGIQIKSSSAVVSGGITIPEK